MARVKKEELSLKVVEVLAKLASEKGIELIIPDKKGKKVALGELVEETITEVIKGFASEGIDVPTAVGTFKKKHKNPRKITAKIITNKKTGKTIKIEEGMTKEKDVLVLDSKVEF